MEDASIYTQKLVDELSKKSKQLEASQQRLDKLEKMIQLGHWDWNVPSNELFWSH